MNMAGALARIREILQGVEGIERVYSVSESDSHDMFPEGSPMERCAAVVHVPETEGYILASNRHSHTYTVLVELMWPRGTTVGDGLFAALGTFDAALTAFARNVTLGGRVTSCLYAEDMRPRSWSWGDDAPVTHVGVEFRLRVIEHEAVTAEVGA